MASRLIPTRLDRMIAAGWRGLVAAAATALPLAAGAVVALSLRATVHSHNFPWITARALGIGGYLALFALVASGTWMRHPWRFGTPKGHAETRLRAHAALGIATVALAAAHVLFLVTDRYAGVGWLGALLPGSAHYRAAAVALGVVAFDLMGAIALTARLAGRPGMHHWLALHRLAGLVFALSWFHGVLAGSDAAVLRPLYVATGAVLALLSVTRVVGGRQTLPPEGDDQSRQGAASDERRVEVHS